MTRAHKSLVALVALATSARAAGPSKAVLALRRTPSNTGPRSWSTTPDASRLRGTTLKNTTHVVHGALPVRSLISNYDKVARALRPTKFKWMLE